MSILADENEKRYLTALKYAERGWPVLPVNPKTRATPQGGHKVATCDPEQIERWRKEWGECNWGTAVGRAGIVVVDVDEWLPWTALLTRLGFKKEPRTMEVSTPRRGGAHLYFKAEGIKSKDGCPVAKIDIKSIGSVVPIAGSVRPGYGTYELDNDCEPIDMPQELLSLLPRVDDVTKPKPRKQSLPGHTGRYGAVALENELATLASAPEGQRNATLNTAAFSVGQLIAGDKLDQAALDQLYDTAIGIGLDPHEVTQTIKSGSKAGSEQPRSVA